MNVNDIPDHALGAALATGGAVGFTVQTLTEWANLAVTLGNLALVLGGVYFMAHRVLRHINQRRRKCRRAGDKQAG